MTDDHSDSADFLARLLQRAGHPARVFSNGPALFAALAEFPLPDLIILDVMMPEMDGIECLQQIRATPLLAGVPVMMYTADLTADRRRQALAAGAQEFLVKGNVRWPTLLATIQRLLGMDIRESLQVPAKV